MSWRLDPRLAPTRSLRSGARDAPPDHPRLAATRSLRSGARPACFALLVLAFAITFPFCIDDARAKPLVGPPFDPANEDQDILYLGDNKPMRLRLHVRIDGEPFERAWNGYMRRLFDYLDVNGNGVLTKDRAERIPSVSFLQSHLQGAIVFLSKTSTAPWSEVDVNPADGNVTLEKLKNYYIRAGFGPMQVQAVPGEGASQALTDALFKALDANKDGKLSKEEILAAPEALARFDFDENEFIAADELVPGINGFRFGTVRADPLQRQIPNPSLVVVPRGEPPLQAANQIISKYDKDKKGKLSRAECGFDEALFAKLDANKDGRLDAQELLKWFAEPPDLELLAQLGKIPEKEPPPLLKPLDDVNKMLTSDAPLEVLNPNKRTLALASALHKRGNGTLLLALDNALIEVQREEGPAASGNYQGIRQFYLQQFRDAAGDKKVLDKKDAAANQFLQGFFTFMDRDGDGKLTEAEVKAFFDVHAIGASAFVTLAQDDNGRGLFEFLDADHDDRLSPRELKNAWKSLEPWDVDGDGCISRSEIPRRLQIQISHGRPLGGQVALAVNSNRAPTRARSGPIWFRKMDRNGDGDVSRKEFLGSDEDFDKIDTNHDGLIDEKEAEAADEWFRKKLGSNK